MKKIPTLFKRDLDDMKHVLTEVTPGCEWVSQDEGIATRKYDGTCVKFDGVHWWARREVKPGKSSPMGFVPVETDENTGKTVGWEPAEQSGFAKFLAEAAEGESFQAGTYELCGPKINGNPEGFEHHELVWHGDVKLMDVPRDYDHLRHWLLSRNYEGIVWHHPDGRMCKLKKRDLA